MANILEIVVRAKDLASSVVRGVGDAVDDTVEEIDSKWSKLSGIGKAAGTAAGAALAAGSVLGVQREAVGDKVAAQLRLDPEEQKKAGDLAGKLYGEAYGDSFEDISGTVAEVMGTFEDLTEEGIERISIKAADLKSAFDIEDAVTRAGILVNTGLANDVDHAMDLITASMQEVAPGLRDEIGEATTEYSKFFADLGFTGEETFALLTAADDKFALDKTGDAIKELTIRATDGSKATVQAFQDMGLNSDQMANAILAGGDDAKAAFDLIVDGLRGIEDPAKQSQTAIALFGTPVEDLSGAQLPEFLESLNDTSGGLQDVEGRADELGDTLNDNANTKIEGYRRAFENVLAKAVELPGVLGEGVAAVGAMGSMLGPFAPMLAVVASQTGILTTVTGGLSKAMAFLAANPIVLVIAAITALIAAIVWLWNNNEDFRAGVIKIWQAIQRAWEVVWQAIQAALQWAWEKIIKPIWDKIKQGVDILIMAIKIYMEVWKTVFTAVGNAAKWAWENVIKPVWDKIKGGIDILKQGIENFRDSWETIWEAIKEAVRGPANGIIGFVNGVLNGIEKMVNGAAKAINSIPSFTIPDWVPFIGGNTYKLPTIPTISLPRIPSLATGGIAMATPGGFLARIAEGGRNERISPIGGPDDPMVAIARMMEELIRAVKEARTLSVDGRELASAIGFPLVEEIRHRTGL